MQQGDAVPAQGRNQGRAGDGQYPGPDNAVGQAPADGREAAGGADADDGPNDGMVRFDAVHQQVGLVLQRFQFDRVFVEFLTGHQSPFIRQDTL